MKCTLGTKLLLWKTDFLSAFSCRRKEILLHIVIASLGIAFGIYFGVKLGEKAQPFCIFARLFRLEYSPFDEIFSEVLRFSIFALIAALSYFLPCYPLYPVFSLFFFGKHFGEIACICFLADSFASALATLLVILLPTLIVGVGLLSWIALHAQEFRVCNGGFIVKSALKKAAKILLSSLVIYAILLFVLHLVLCGSIYILLVVL